MFTLNSSFLTRGSHLGEKLFCNFITGTQKQQKSISPARGFFYGIALPHLPVFYYPERALTIAVKYFLFYPFTCDKLNFRKWINKHHIR